MKLYEWISVYQNDDGFNSDWFNDWDIGGNYSGNTDFIGGRDFMKAVNPDG